MSEEKEEMLFDNVVMFTVTSKNRKNENMVASITMSTTTEDFVPVTAVKDDLERLFQAIVRNYNDFTGLKHLDIAEIDNAKDEGKDDPISK